MGTMLRQLTTNEIGRLLEQKYAPPVDQDTHIEYFYLRVPENKSSEAEDLLTTLWTELEAEDSALVDKDWPGFILVPFENGADETAREKKLEDKIRFPLANGTGTSVVFSRACLYRDYQLAQETVTTKDIGEILNSQRLPRKRGPCSDGEASMPAGKKPRIRTI